LKDEREIREENYSSSSKKKQNKLDLVCCCCTGNWSATKNIFPGKISFSRTQWTLGDVLTADVQFYGITLCPSLVDVCDGKVTVQLDDIQNTISLILFCPFAKKKRQKKAKSFLKIHLSSVNEEGCHSISRMYWCVKA
jgi:hypothetical protein